MSKLTSYHLILLSLVIPIVNTIAIDSSTANELVSVNLSAPASKLGLDIGLEPIIMNDVAQTTSPQSSKIAPLTTTTTKQPLGLGISTRIGTLGIGVDVAKSITPHVNGRLGFNFGKIDVDRNDSGISYASQLNLSSVQLSGDYYPFSSNGFRVTGGLIAQSNKFSVTSKPSVNGSYTIDGKTYQTSDVGTLTGEYQYSNSIAPYLGIGIGKSTNAGFGFNADVGVMFAGAPKVSLNASNPTFNNNPITRTQLDNQVRQTENDLKGFNLYPVLSIGLSYGF
jgi:hypothetical protein